VQNNLDIVLTGYIPGFPGYEQRFVFLVKIEWKKTIGSEKTVSRIHFAVIPVEDLIWGNLFFPVRHKAVKPPLYRQLIGRIGI
jgi:hypothetical protein